MRPEECENSLLQVSRPEPGNNPTGTQNQISEHICANIENSGHSSLPGDTAYEPTRRRLLDHLDVRPSDPRTIIPALADAAHVSPQTTAGILMNGSIISTGLPLDAPRFEVRGDVRRTCAARPRRPGRRMDPEGGRGRVDDPLGERRRDRSGLIKSDGAGAKVLGPTLSRDPPMRPADCAGLPGRTPSSHRLETHHDHSRTPRPHAVREP